MTDDEIYGPRRGITVIAPCYVHHPHHIYESDVEILDIEEDIQGRDVLTFICPLCSQQHKSYRYG